jgi:hypothetical protein
MRHTPRKLKFLKLELNFDKNNIAVDKLINYLEIIGGNVTKLSLRYIGILYHLKQIIQALPNLETIIFKEIDLKFHDDEDFEVTCMKSHSITFIFRDQSDINFLCKHLKLTNKNLRHFTLICHLKQSSFYHCFNVKKIQQIIGNNPMMTTICEEYDRQNRIYTFEAEMNSF